MKLLKSDCFNLFHPIFGWFGSKFWRAPRHLRFGKAAIPSCSVMLSRSRFPAQALARGFASTAARRSPPFVGPEGPWASGHCSQAYAPGKLQQRVMAAATKVYLAVGVALIALIAAGEAFISSPVVSTPLSQPSSATTRPVRQTAARGSKNDAFWKAHHSISNSCAAQKDEIKQDTGLMQAAASMTLLSLSMGRLAQRRQGKATHRKISVACFAAPCEPATTFAVKEIRAVADLIDMTDVTIPEVANTPSCTEEVQENLSTESSTSPSSPHSARFIGASRFRAARAQRPSRATRHAMGKRLCERPAVAPAETQSFDVSRLREKIQKGLRISQGRRCGRSREGRGVAASCRSAVGCHSLMEVELHVQKAYIHHSSIDQCSIVASSMESVEARRHQRFQGMDAMRSAEAGREKPGAIGCSGRGSEIAEAAVACYAYDTPDALAHTKDASIRACLSKLSDQSRSAMISCAMILNLFEQLLFQLIRPTFSGPHLNGRTWASPQRAEPRREPADVWVIYISYVGETVHHRGHQTTKITPWQSSADWAIARDHVVFHAAGIPKC
eukprot:s271_g27.t1